RRAGDLPTDAARLLRRAYRRGAHHLARAVVVGPPRRAAGRVPDRARCRPGDQQLAIDGWRPLSQLAAVYRRRETAGAPGQIDGPPAHDWKTNVRMICSLAALLVAALLTACSNPAASGGIWSPTAAAAYLDRRTDWWMAWPQAARDRGTFCVSCHTALPYSLSRASLGQSLADPTPSATHRRLLHNVTTPLP